jgi:fructokinase
MILAFGEVLWDLLPSGKQLGGAVANCAFRLQQLGNEVMLVSKLGSDDLGAEARRILTEKGLSCTCIQTDSNYPTGTVDVTIDNAGDADYVINPEVAYDYIETDENLLSLARNAEAIVFGNLIQRNLVSRSSLYTLLDIAPDALKIIDINIRKDCYTSETLKESVKRTDVLKLNEKEVEILSQVLNIPVPSLDFFCMNIADTYQLQSVLVSLGSRGVFAFDSTEGIVSFPAHEVRIADTVGAGDNFTAGFTHARINGKSFPQCCKFANLLGALASSKAGGMPEITSEEIGILNK